MAVTLTTESRGSPDAPEGTKTLPGMAASAVLDVMTAATVVFRRLALKGSDCTTRTGLRVAPALTGRGVLCLDPRGRVLLLRWRDPLDGRFIESRQRRARAR
jgi:hypothetical protein